MSNKILIVANTIIGKEGNIGFRLGKVFQELNATEFLFVARGLSSGVNGISLGVFGSTSRFLNAIRRYIFPRFNSRRYDIYIFNLAVYILWWGWLRFDTTVRVIYLCESSAFLAKFFTRNGYKVVLDVPIAPSYHIKTLHPSLSNKSFNFNKFLDKQERTCYETVSSIICPSNYVSELIYSIVPASKDKIIVIPFGVDAHDSTCFQTNRMKKKIESKDVVIGYLGNISQRKGCVELVNSWRTLGKVDGFRLLMQGRIYPEMRSMLVHEQFEIRPFGDKASFYASIDVLILPSFMEGSAKVIYEAIAHGVPVYASKYSGAPFFDGNLITQIETVNVDVLIEIFEKLKLNGVRKISIAEREKFINRYSWSTYSTKVLRVLK